MAKLSILARASDDLFAIWDHIAADNLPAADRLIAAIAAKIDLLADFPEMGAPRDDVLTGGRQLIHGHYIVFYQFDRTADMIEVLTVVYGGRDLTQLF